jgi:hypothetical protein
MADDEHKKMLSFAEVDSVNGQNISDDTPKDNVENAEADENALVVRKADIILKDNGGDVKKVNLIYKFNGDFEDGADLFLVVQSMHSLGTLITESKVLLYPEAPPMSVRVAPFAKGSFEIELFIQASTNLQMILDIIKSQDGRDIKDLLEYIGLISNVVTIMGTTALGAIGLFRWLKRKPRKVEKINDNTYKYTNVDDDVAIVSEQVHKLAQNEIVRRAIYTSIAIPLEDAQIENIECSLRGDSETTTKIEKDIIEPLKDCASGIFPSADTLTEELESTREVWVYPKKANFEGGQRSWTFAISGDSRSAQTMIILDDTFLGRVKGGTIRLSASDMLRVRLRERQVLQGNKATMEYEILKVLEHKMFPVHEQLSMLDNLSQNTTDPLEGGEAGE